MPACLFLAWPATAQNTPDVESMASLSGTCERMVITGEDISEVCRGPLYNVAYRSGRISFAFPGGDEASNTQVMVSFSGTEQRREGDRIMLLLDRITLVGNEEEGESTAAAEGICEYSDPAAGPMQVRCAGHTQAGDFAGIFATDGKPPTTRNY